MPLKQFHVKGSESLVLLRVKGNVRWRYRKTNGVESHVQVGDILKYSCEHFGTASIWNYTGDCGSCFTQDQGAIKCGCSQQLDGHWPGCSLGGSPLCSHTTHSLSQKRRLEDLPSSVLNCYWGQESRQALKRSRAERAHTDKETKAFLFPLLCMVGEMHTVLTSLAALGAMHCHKNFWEWKGEKFTFQMNHP